MNAKATVSINATYIPYLNLEYLYTHYVQLYIYIYIYVYVCTNDVKIANEKIDCRLLYLHKMRRNNDEYATRS